MNRQIFQIRKIICLNSRAFFLTFLSIFFLLSASSAAICQKPTPTTEGSQANQAIAQKEYQNQQRALRLVLMKTEIKALDDAPMRCLARLEIVRFIYDNDVRNEFDSADAMSIDYFEDIAGNPEQIPEASAGRWQNLILSLLRQKSPDLAKKVEKKYMSKVDSSVADLQELDSAYNTKEIADRTIAKILKGDVSDYVLTIHDKIRPTDPKSADRILAALLSYWEKIPDISHFGRFIDFIGGNYTRESAPVELKIRYCRFAVNLARGQIGETDSGPTARFILRTLKGVLPTIKETIPELFTEAQSIFIVLDARLNKDNRERVEAYARIEAAEDKLQQVIAEAESANDPKLRDSFWGWAARIAVEKKKLKLAVDLAMKGEVNMSGIHLGRDQFLVGDALPAILKEKDFELADHVLALIGDDMFSVRALLPTATALIEAKENEQAFEKLSASLKLLEKGDADEEKVRYIFNAIPIALKIDKSTGFDVLSRAINLTNHLRTPSVDEKIGTPARLAYVSKIMLPASYSILTAFKLLAATDLAYATSAADDLKSKNYRLIAEIVVETERKYPLPKEQKKID